MLPPFTPRLLAFDLDGTLIPDGGAEIQEETAPVLRRLRASGTKLVILTARDRLPKAVMDDVQPHAVALMNGALIQIADQVVAEVGFTPQDLALILDHQISDAQVVVSTRTDNFAVLSDDQAADPHIQDRMKQHGVLRFSTDVRETALKVRFVHAEVARHAEVLRPHIGLTVTGAVAPYTESMVVTAAAANKATALQMIADALAVPLEYAVAFGDSDNDRCMLEKAGYAVQIGDHTYLKTVADAQVAQQEALSLFLSNFLDYAPEP